MRSALTPVAAGVLLAFAGAAQAATKTGSFVVSATVAKNCVINAPNLDLGSFDGTNDLAVSSAITVNCTSGTTFSVDLSPGSSNSYAMRTLVNGTDHLNYNLYTSGGYGTVWGDATGGTGHATGTGTGMGVPQQQSLTVYGRLLASDNTGPVSAGTYNDTIVATITY
jgi:spore coat protein U-like protein